MDEATDQGLLIDVLVEFFHVPTSDQNAFDADEIAKALGHAGVDRWTSLVSLTDEDISLLTIPEDRSAGIPSYALPLAKR